MGNIFATRHELRLTLIYISQTLSPLASQKVTSSPYSSVVVVDTNFLISHLAFLKMLILEYAKKYKLLVIIPWIVLEELDGLKSRSNNSYANSSKSNQPNVANLAQIAISFLHNCLAEKHDGLRGQKIHEKIEKPKNNDDKILDCCRYFQATTRSSIILLSNDKNLCIKAMVHDIHAFSYQKASGLEELLEKILSTDNSSSDSVLYKHVNSAIQWPKVNELETIERENHNGSNIVYNIKEEPECFIEDADTMMMDCDDTIQKTPFSQNVIPESSETVMNSQISQPYYSRSSLSSNEKQFNPSYSSLHDSIHAPDNRNQKLDGNNQKNKNTKRMPSTNYSNPKNFLMDYYDTKQISESYTTNSSLSTSHPVQTSYSFSMKDEFNNNSSSSLYASIHAPGNLDMFNNNTTSNATNNANNKINREAEVISMMLFTTPSISKKLLDKTIETSHKYLVNKIMANLSNSLPPAILFHFQNCFGKDWNYIVQEPQPWSLNTMIKFIDRYWITVFSDVFHQFRKIKEVIISNILDFLRVYQRSDGANLTIQDVMQFIQNSELILKMIFDDIEETIESISEREQLVKNWWSEFEHSLRFK
ncbi:pin domain-containing protein [Gigaspora margarita]|uniref:Transcriptional protein SWT1 n=1 Tax=Gigaspora margarita TaxID=4874 RepID=A0A8H4AQA6_GIGMA|nr:pin domain-containing protein [Gigaspora margarita]